VADVAAPIITFLSDYGHRDDFVGVCHAVIARICPEARVIDLVHDLPRHGLRPAALTLRKALPYLPVGVHLAVVDPEVGAERRAVALGLADGRTLVGPDNGVLSLAAEVGGGVIEAVEIGRSRFRLEPVSATFHGRDLFAPVAAQLAAGAPLADAGEPLDPAELVVLELPRGHVEADGTIVAHALTIDRFGNVELDVDHEQLAGAGLKLGQRVELALGERRVPAQYARTFADVSAGELIVYEDAYRMLAIAVNRGSAAEALGLEPDAELRVSPA
jgi:S-adenosyl-L-methionine hydrolase (adenosine-forming)